MAFRVVVSLASVLLVAVSAHEDHGGVPTPVPEGSVLIRQYVAIVSQDLPTKLVKTNSTLLVADLPTKTVGYLRTLLAQEAGQAVGAEVTLETSVYQAPPPAKPYSLCVEDHGGVIHDSGSSGSAGSVVAPKSAQTPGQTELDAKLLSDLFLKSDIDKDHTVELFSIAHRVV